MVVVVVVVVVVVDFYYEVVHRHGGGKRLGTCLVVKPCALCVVSLQHVCMHHLRRSPKAVRYTRYILAPQKGTEIALLRKAKVTCLIIKYKNR